jgi:hypothetical protein
MAKRKHNPAEKEFEMINTCAKPQSRKRQKKEEAKSSQKELIATQKQVNISTITFEDDIYSKEEIERFISATVGTQDKLSARENF